MGIQLAGALVVPQPDRVRDRRQKGRNQLSSPSETLNRIGATPT
ncbi:hypothetical protein [[Phormidium] sp. ETS-05]|nr:hypothetical protein [[Phormidium] sp. ETS-05]